MYKFIGIAIDEYKDPLILNLNNCKNDIDAIVQVLSQKYKFDEFEIIKAEEQTTKSFIYNTLFDILKNSLPEDSLLIYFAGHGIYHSDLDETYWQTSDSINNDITTWFNLSDLQKLFKISVATHIALISDSCFSGAIFNKFRGGGIEAIENKISRQALTSGSVEKVLDGKSENSPFNQTVIKILSQNINNELPFIDFSQKVILDFNTQIKQTPIFGSLENTGHDGGSFIFKIIDNEPELYKEIHLPLKLNSNIKVDSTFVLPQFNENTFFDNNFVNSFISQLGNSIISGARSSFSNFDEKQQESRYNSYSLDFNYYIEIISDTFLSILFTREEYYGGALHPNTYFYTLNFTYMPERQIFIYDIIDMSDYPSQSDFFHFCIQNSEESEEIKEELTKYFSKPHMINNINSSDLEFTFNENKLNLYVTNFLPRLLQAIGLIEISLEKLKLIKAIDLHNK